MRYGSVCSGVEAASVAWEPLGWNPVFFAEMDEFPSAVLAHHWPDVPNHGDMTKFEEWGYERGAIDVLVGGTPCQSFSIAGLRQGLNSANGNLALTYCRMVDRLRPRWFVWENVPGVLSSNGGRDFSSIVSAMAELGYSIVWRVLDAQNFGVPQRRRRVFIVGCSSGDWRDPAKVLFEQSCGAGDFKKGRESREENTGGTALCFENNRRDGIKSIVYDMKQHHAPQRSETVQLTTEKCSAIRGDSPMVLHGTQDPIVSDKAHTLGRNQGQENVVVIHDKATRHKGGGDTRNNDGAGNVLGLRDGGPMYTVTSCDRHGVFFDSIVRRLTPVETERLQGFPDSHTDIGWKGKPTPDSHRYKAMGNSMAVPVMRWIGERIQKHDQEMRAK